MVIIVITKLRIFFLRTENMFCQALVDLMVAIVRTETMALCQSGQGSKRSNFDEKKAKSIGLRMISEEDTDGFF